MYIVTKKISFSISVNKIYLNIASNGMILRFMLYQMSTKLLSTRHGFFGCISRENGRTDFYETLYRCFM